MTLQRPFLLAFASIFAAMGLQLLNSSQAFGLTLNNVDLKYPVAKEIPFTSIYHGEVQVQNYAWMELDHAQEARDYVRQQNALTRQVLDSAPQRQSILTTLQQLNIATEPIPKFENGVGYVSTGTAIYRIGTDLKRGDLVVDLAQIKDQTGLLDLNRDKPAIVDFSQSPDQTKLAILVSLNGKDFNAKIFIYSLADQQVLKNEVIHQALNYTPVFGNIGGTPPVWTSDSRSFLYTRFFTNWDLGFPLNTALAPGRSEIARHTLGQLPSQDVVAFSRSTPGSSTNEILQVRALINPNQALVTMFNTYFAPNFVGTLELSSGNVTYLQETAKIDGVDKHFGYLGEANGLLYFYSNLKAANSGIVAFPQDSLRFESAQEVVKGRNATAEVAFLATSKLVVVYAENQFHQIEVYDLKGSLLDRLALPGKGSVGGFSVDEKNGLFYFGYTDFTSPRRLMAYDLNRLQLTELHSPATPSFDPNDFSVSRETVRASDGALIPITIFEKKNAPSWNKSPIYLYFYGNLAAGIFPQFLPKYMAWVQRGGRVVLAHVRGGTDVDWKWAESGVRLHKERGLDDVIEVAQSLTQTKGAPAKNILLAGRSSAGFASAAAVLKSPESFGALATAVPLVDMLRYDQFTCGTRWEIEYGLASNLADYKVLKKLSPLLLSIPGQVIPPTIIFAAEKDDRVPTHHAMKLAATLQKNSGHLSPVLLYEEPGLSHGSKRETADELTFASLVIEGWQ